MGFDETQSVNSGQDSGNNSEVNMELSIFVS